MKLCFLFCFTFCQTELITALLHFKQKKNSVRGNILGANVLILKEGPGFTFSCAAFFHCNCFVEPETNQVENKGHKNITCKHKTEN